MNNVIEVFRQTPVPDVNNMNLSVSDLSGALKELLNRPDWPDDCADRPDLVYQEADRFVEFTGGAWKMEGIDQSYYDYDFERERYNPSMCYEASIKCAHFGTGAHRCSDSPVLTLATALIEALVHAMVADETNDAAHADIDTAI